MAEKKEKEKAIVLERIYNVPLRREWLKVPMHKRAKKSVKALRQFLARHMKTDIENIRVGRWVNEELWEKGTKNPPHHIRVRVKKYDDGIAIAEPFELSGRAKIIEEKEKRLREETEKKKPKEKKEERHEEKKEKETKAEEEVKEEEKEVMQKTAVKPAMHEHEHQAAQKHEPLHPHRIALQK